jgi:hypothetical protein
MTDGGATVKLIAVLGAFVVAGLSATAGAATPAADVMVPVHTFIDSFNKGDTKTAAAQISPDGMLVVDEIAPFSWSGTKAFETWGQALEEADKAAGNTDARVTDAKPVRVEVSTDHAYVVVPAVYTFKQKGVAMKETARMAITLQKGKTGWLITGLAWAGTRPQPVSDNTVK